MATMLDTVDKFNSEMEMDELFDRHLEDHEGALDEDQGLPYEDMDDGFGEDDDEEDAAAYDHRVVAAGPSSSRAADAAQTAQRHIMSRHSHQAYASADDLDETESVDEVLDEEAEYIPSTSLTANNPVYARSARSEFGGLAEETGFGRGNGQGADDDDDDGDGRAYANAGRGTARQHLDAQQQSHQLAGDDDDDGDARIDDVEPVEGRSDDAVAGRGGTAPSAVTAPSLAGAAAAAVSNAGSYRLNSNAGSSSSRGGGGGATHASSAEMARDNPQGQQQQRVVSATTTAPGMMTQPRPCASCHHPTVSDFKIIRVIGKGSFGKVFLVRQVSTSSIYAMKVLKKENIVKRNQVEHTKTERSVLGYVRHPFVVGLRAAFQTHDKLFFVLDYCAGGELFCHLQKLGKFAEPRARFYTAELTLALEHVHAFGVVYRDLKPENVLLDARGHVRLTDFGLSKEGVTAHHAGAHSFCGTPEYLAPEILARRGHGRAVDWWSLGALLYEMLTGLPPFYSRDREQLFEGIKHGHLAYPRYLSADAKKLLKALLCREPARRLGSGPTDADEVKRHAFFARVDWDALLDGAVQPPWQPAVVGSLDTSQFDREFTSLPIHSPPESANVAAASSAAQRPPGGPGGHLVGGVVGDPGASNHAHGNGLGHGGPNGGLNGHHHAGGPQMMDAVLSSTSQLHRQRRPQADLDDLEQTFEGFTYTSPSVECGRHLKALAGGAGAVHRHAAVPSQPSHPRPRSSAGRR